MDEPRQAMWSGRVAFIMATTGATIGLGNLWRFPYMASEYGGILFVLIYLVCITFIGLPIIMAEVMIGRMGRQSPINGIRVLAEKNGRSRHWQLIGAIDRQGYTLVPTAMYWKKGKAKLEIGLAKGKKQHDKRASIKARDWEREKHRVLKSR